MEDMRSSDQPQAGLKASSGPSGESNPAIQSWLIPQALRKLPSLKYALGIAAIMALFALGKAAFASPSEAIFGAAAMLSLMFVLVVFNWVSKSGPSFLHAPASALIWALVVLFIASATATVTSVFLDLPKPFPALMDGIKGQPAGNGGNQRTSSSPNVPAGSPQPAALQANTPAVPGLSSPSLNHETPVPVKITAVYQGTLSPAPHTILTVSTADGNVVRGEVIPDKNGEARLALQPGRYSRRHRWREGGQLRGSAARHGGDDPDYRRARGGRSSCT